MSKKRSRHDRDGVVPSVSKKQSLFDTIAALEKDADDGGEDDETLSHDEADSDHDDQETEPLRINNQRLIGSAKQRSGYNRDEARRYAATSQTNIYGKLLECRILFQGAVSAAKKTQPRDNEDIGRQDGDEETTNENADEYSESIEVCNELLLQLLQARHSLVPGLVVDNDNEYLALLGRDHDESSDDERSLNSVLQDQYEHCRSVWEEVLNRRHESVQLHSGRATPSTSQKSSQFRVFDSSFWQQVQATYQHEILLLKQRNDGMPDLDKFDDSKVYQQLLKEFVTTATPSSGNNTSALEQPNFATRVRNHGQAASKGAVDRKASKGRKIRYHEMPKLVNFTFPLSRRGNSVRGTNPFQSQGSSLSDDAYFRSLFGGSVAMRSPET
jgi:protein AATF/BFR2